MGFVYVHEKARWYDKIQTQQRAGEYRRRWAAEQIIVEIFTRLFLVFAS